jgi:hypothetical protein
MLGQKLPRKPKMLQVMYELAKTKRMLKGKSDDVLLLALGPLQSKVKTAAMRLLSSLLSFVCGADESELIGLTAMKMIKIIDYEWHFSHVSYQFRLLGYSEWKWWQCTSIWHPCYKDGTPDQRTVCVALDNCLCAWFPNAQGRTSPGLAACLGRRLQRWNWSRTDFPSGNLPSLAYVDLAPVRNPSTRSRARCENAL